MTVIMYFDVNKSLISIFLARPVMHIIPEGSVLAAFAPHHKHSGEGPLGATPMHNTVLHD
jgi:hypothetical protein